MESEVVSLAALLGSGEKENVTLQRCAWVMRMPSIAPEQFPPLPLTHPKPGIISAPQWKDKRDVHQFCSSKKRQFLLASLAAGNHYPDGKKLLDAGDTHRTLWLVVPPHKYPSLHWDDYMDSGNIPALAKQIAHSSHQLFNTMDERGRGWLQWYCTFRAQMQQLNKLGLPTVIGDATHWSDAHQRSLFESEICPTFLANATFTPGEPSAGHARLQWLVQNAWELLLSLPCDSSTWQQHEVLAKGQFKKALLTRLHKQSQSNKLSVEQENVTAAQPTNRPRVNAIT